MKFGTLKSIAHNIADSLASGIGLMIGVYELYVWDEAAWSPEGYIEVDFLTGESSGGKPSLELDRALKLYAEALPDLCGRHGAQVSDFRQLKARYSGSPTVEGFTVTVEDRNGRRSEDDYLRSGRRPKVLDRLGRVRGT
jgi:hypothetical protein